MGTILIYVITNKEILKIIKIILKEKRNQKQITHNDCSVY